MRHLAISIALLASLSATGCGASLRNQASHGKLHAVAVDPKIEKDINLGFASYETVLTRWGRWEQDEWYGVRWCPDPKHTPVKFVPYKSRGHWTASAKPIAQAPAGSPYWVSDDSETWGEITMHHGYWVHIDTRAPSWCWIPGVEETAGRVVWRTGEGFVGWAPEPPVWVDDGGEGVIANLLWNFVFLGALLENDLEPQYLEGEAYGAAVASSSPVRATRDAYAPARPNVNGEGERVPANPTVGNAMRVGPPMAKVAEARLVLAGYASTHEGKLPAGGLGGSEGVKSGASGAAPDKGTSTSKKDEKLPSGVVVYTSLSTLPMIGPVGITPRYYRIDKEPYATTIEPASRPSSGSSSSPPSYASPSFASTPSYSSPHSSASSSSSSSSSSSHSSSSQGSSYSPASSSRSTSASSSSSSHDTSFRGGGSRSSR